MTTNILQTITATIFLLLEQITKESERTGKSAAELLGDAAKQIGLNEQQIEQLRKKLQSAK